VTLFNQSIKDNIRIGRQDATDEEIMQAAQLANCDEFVSRLPDGYDTVIGENGSELSGGERQRISIARAFLKNAPIILLDEASASLDVENETAIQTALSRLIKDKTVIVIAHRMRTVSGADKIAVLADGIVQESGKPDELLAQNGILHGWFAHKMKVQRGRSINMMKAKDIPSDFGGMSHFIMLLHLLCFDLMIQNTSFQFFPDKLNDLLFTFFTLRRKCKHRICMKGIRFYMYGVIIHFAAFEGFLIIRRIA
jgi:hypothetical protein